MKHEACYGEHHGGRIIHSPFDSMKVGVCAVCSIHMAFDDEDGITIPMTEHIARNHPAEFEKIANRIAETTGIQQFQGMTAADYLTYRKEDEYWNTMEGKLRAEGLGNYL